MYSKPGRRERLPQFRHDPVLSFPDCAPALPSSRGLLVFKPKGLSKEKMT
jgi:hypothetical protein